MDTAPDLLFTNARLVLPDQVVRGSLAVRDGHILDVDTSGSALPGAIDLTGDYLIPGLIELHTDNLERHLMPRPRVAWPPLPALVAHDAEIAAAGITTVFDALGVGSGDPTEIRGASWQEFLDTLALAREQDALRVEHRIHVRCELPAPNAIDLFTPFRDHPLVGLISLMDHTPGQRQWENLDKARIYYTGKKGWSEAKFMAEVQRGPELAARYAAPHRQYFVAYCQERGIPMASHDDTTVAHVDQAHAEQVRIAEFPTSLAAARRARELDMATVMGAPNVIRGGSHSGNVAASVLARAGLLDILSSDYVPASLLTSAFRLAGQLDLPLARTIAMVTSTPARMAGLPDRGALAPGLRADLVRVRLAETIDHLGHPLVQQVWHGGRRVI